MFVAEVESSVGDERSRYVEVFGDASSLPPCKEVSHKIGSTHTSLSTHTEFFYIFD